MKFIRHIIVGLALLAAFIVLSIFSSTEYTVEKTNLNSTEDKLPGVNIVLSKFSDLLSLADKIPAADFLSVAKTEVDYNTEMSKDIYNNMAAITKNTPNIKEEKIKELASSTPDIIKKANWLNLFNKLKETLSKDWSRP